jgi:hypothetical protein
MALSPGRAALPLHEVCLFRLGIHLGELWHPSELPVHLWRLAFERHGAAFVGMVVKG